MKTASWFPASGDVGEDVGDHVAKTAHRPETTRPLCCDRPVAENRADPHPPRRSGGRPRPRQGPAHAARAGLRPGALAADERVLELRDLVHDHLDPVRDADPVLPGHQLRRSGGGGLRLADRLRLRDHRRARDGRDRLEVPDRGRPLLLGVQDGRRQLGLVHRLVQPDRPDRDHGRHRLRRRALHGRAAAAALARHVQGHTARSDLRLRRDPGVARVDEHLQRQARRAAERHLRVVALPRRADHRRLPDLQARPSPVVRDGVLEDDQQQRLLARLAVVRAVAGAVASPVHVHGLRRVGAHERGDAGRVSRSGPRDHHVGRRLGNLRLHPGARRHLRHPGLCGDDRSRHVRGEADLPRLARRHDGEGDAGDHRRCTVLLRDVVDHVGVADDVRVLS